MQGLGGALFEAIEFADGHLRNGTMEQYRVPRFKDTPIIETILLDRRDIPSAGAGESSMIAVAPAIGSAARGLGQGRHGAADPAAAFRLRRKGGDCDESVKRGRGRRTSKPISPRTAS